MFLRSVGTYLCQSKTNKNRMMKKKILALLLLIATASFALADTPVRPPEATPLTPPSGETPPQGPKVIIKIIGPFAPETPQSLNPNGPLYPNNVSGVYEFMDLSITPVDKRWRTYFWIDCHFSSLNIAYAWMSNLSTGEVTADCAPSGGYIALPVSRTRGDWRINIVTTSGELYSGQISVSPGSIWSY